MAKAAKANHQDCGRSHSLEPVYLPRRAKGARVFEGAQGEEGSGEFCPKSPSGQRVVSRFQLAGQDDKVMHCQFSFRRLLIRVYLHRTLCAPRRMQHAIELMSASQPSILSRCRHEACLERLCCWRRSAVEKPRRFCAKVHLKTQSRSAHRVKTRLHVAYQPRRFGTLSPARLVVLDTVIHGVSSSCQASSDRCAAAGIPSDLQHPPGHLARSCRALANLRGCPGRFSLHAMAA